MTNHGNFALRNLGWLGGPARDLCCSLDDVKMHNHHKMDTYRMCE